MLCVCLCSYVVPSPKFVRQMEDQQTEPSVLSFHRSHMADSEDDDGEGEGVEEVEEESATDEVSACPVHGVVDGCPIGARFLNFPCYYFSYIFWLII